MKKIAFNSASLKNNSKFSSKNFDGGESGKELMSHSGWVVEEISTQKTTFAQLILKLL